MIGAGSVTLLHTGHAHDDPQENLKLEGSGLVEIAAQRASHVHQYQHKESFPLAEIGPFRAYHPEANLPPEIWREALRVQESSKTTLSHQPSQAVLDLVAGREKARENKDWAAADELRQQIAAMGWQLMDTKDGPRLSPLDPLE